MSSSDHWIYAYPIALGFKESEVSETFVTFDEPNLFVEPYDNIWIKLAATVIYLIGVVGSFIQYSFVIYEVNGYAASFRTAISQLVSSCYFLVSFKTIKVMKKQEYHINIEIPACNIFISGGWIRLIQSVVWSTSIRILPALSTIERNSNLCHATDYRWNSYYKVSLHLCMERVQTNE